MCINKCGKEQKSKKSFNGIELLLLSIILEYTN